MSSDADDGSDPSTNTTMPMTTHPAALDIAEGLENILGRLPQKSITRSMRVCHFFNNVIKNSHQLQRHLFIRPVPWRGSLPLPESFESTTLHSILHPKRFIDINALLISANDESISSYDAGVWGSREDDFVSIWFGFDSSKIKKSDQLSAMVTTRPIIPMELWLWNIESTSGYWIKDISVDDDSFTLADLEALKGTAIKKFTKRFREIHPMYKPLYKSSAFVWRVIFEPEYRFRIDGQEWPTRSPEEVKLETDQTCALGKMKRVLVEIETSGSEKALRSIATLPV